MRILDPLALECRSRRATRQMAGLLLVLFWFAWSHPAAADDSDLEREIALGVNSYRESIGKPALEVDPRISGIARAHSRKMAAGETGLAHEGMRDRGAEIAEFAALAKLAENVSKHERDRSEVPAAAVRGWIASSVHRRNMEGDYTLTGVGVAVAADGTIFTTQIFVATRPAD